MSRGTHLILVEVPEQKLGRQREDLNELFAQEGPPIERALNFLCSPIYGCPQFSPGTDPVPCGHNRDTEHPFLLIVSRDGKLWLGCFSL